MLNGSFSNSILKLIKMPTIPFNNNVGRITSIIPNAKIYLTSGYIVSLEGAKKLFNMVPNNLHHQILYILMP